MGDYRQFCPTCDAEVGFGRHQPGCPVPAHERDLEYQREKARSERQKKLQQPWEEITNKEEFFADAYDLKERIDRLSKELHELDSEFMAARQVMVERDWLMSFIQFSRKSRV